MIGHREHNRVANPKVALREITREDSERLYRWRTDPESRFMFRNSTGFSRARHEDFIKQYFESANRDRWFIVQAGGEPVGTVALYDFSPDGKTVEWGRLIITPEARGNGYGRLAFELLLACCRRLGVKRIRACVFEHNKLSLRIHRALDFAETHRESIDGRELIWFARDLP